jgi:hypothetical protein
MELKLIEEIQRIRAEAKRKLRLADLQQAYYHALGRIPSKYQLVFSKIVVFYHRRVYTRDDLNQFWLKMLKNLREGHISLLELPRAAYYFLVDFQLTTIFALRMLTKIRS